MYTRDEIWKLVSSLIPEELEERVCLFKGVKKWEDEVKDIVDSIEELAISVEKALSEVKGVK